MQQTSDGGYVIAGTTLSFGAGHRDIYLIKTNAQGDTVWSRTYGGTDDDEGRFVQQTTDGGYVIVGFTWSFGAGSVDVYCVKTNAAGDTLWTRNYGGKYVDAGYSVQQTADSGYIIAGRYSTSIGNLDVYLVRTNAGGDTLWTRTYGGPDADLGFSICHTADGGFISAGLTESFGAGYQDVYAIKTDSLGSLCVAEEVSKPHIMSSRLAATVTRSLPADAVVFDAMGRRVVSAKPGVYFVRDEGRGTGDVGRIRKVILQR